MKTLTPTLIHALALGALLATAAGCSKDAAPDSMTRDVIIETGYVECGAPDDACDGVARCLEANDAEICVQAPADQCVDALTCDCVGAWVCGELPCVDVDAGFTCGEDPEPPPPEQECLRIAPEALDFGRVLVGDPTQLSVTLIADCAATLDGIRLLDETDPAFSLARNLERPGIEAGGEMAAGDTIEITVNVDAAEPGPLRGTLRVDGDAVLEVSLTAEAERPIAGDCLMAEATTLDFGAVELGSTARISVQVAASCDGDLASMFEPGSPDFTIVEPVDGPVQAGEGFALIVEFAPQATGDARATFTLSGAGQPLSFTLLGEGTDPLPDCRDAGVGCLGGLVCSRAGQCVPQTRFIITQEDDDTSAFYLQIWPNDAEVPHLVIESADNEFTAFNPGNIFEPCDACGAAPDCAERPATVIEAGRQGSIVWDGTWWLSDTPDGDDCARPQQIVDGLFTAQLCGSFEVELAGEPGEDGAAPGVIGESRCMPATEFDVATGGDVVVNIESE